MLTCFLLMQRTGDPAILKWTSPALALYFFLTTAILFIAFQKQLQYNPYSYNTIYYSGFGLFILSLAITHTYISVQTLIGHVAYDQREIMFILLNSAKNYLNLSTPALLFFSAGLFISNLELQRHDGRGFVNRLAMTLAILIVGGLLVIGFLNDRISSRDPDALLPNLLINLAAAIYLYFECMMIGTIIADVIAAKYIPEHDKDILIIPGAGLEKDGTPTPLLQNRVDLAKVFYQDQLKENGRAAILIPSGGQGADEIQSEAAAMTAYLIAQGIPQEHIFMEDRSVNTAENMKFSKEIITRIAPDAKIAFFTSDFHVFRAGLKARRVKMKAQGMGSPTRWYFWPNASVREFVGLLTEHRKKQLAIFAGLTGIYVLLTVLIFK